MNVGFFILSTFPSFFPCDDDDTFITTSLCFIHPTLLKKGKAGRRLKDGKGEEGAEKTRQ